MNRKKSFKIMARLIVLVKPLLHFMLLAIFLGTLGFLSAIFIPVLGSMGALAALGYDTGITVGTACVCLVIFGVIRGFLRYGEQACNHYIAFRLLAVIRDKVFAALRNLCPAKLEGRDKGNLISIITSDVELLEVFYAHTISPIMIFTCVSVIMLAFIGRLSMYAALVAFLAYVTVGIVIPVINGGHVGDSGMKYRDAAGSLNSLFLDSLRGLTELIQYGMTKLKADEISKNTDGLGEIHKGLKRHEIISGNVTNIAVFIFNIIMLTVCSVLCYTGKLDFSGAVICIVSLMSSYGPAIALSSLSNSLAQTLASGERVLSLLDEQPQTEDITDGVDLTPENVFCGNVRFAYSGEPVLDGISIEAPKNTITGIYGKSGCGKSTLLKLIMRFWERDGGDIELSGEDVNRINTECLRRNESYCTQETYLFNDTIGNNIKIAKMTASDDEVVRAARAASIHDFISELPSGYDTPIGELGDRLSGGEKQRIGLARAFLSGAPVMLLDEPTSNLDSLNEAIILKSLKNTKDKTVIIVSHRKSTLGIADRVYSLESERKS